MRCSSYPEVFNAFNLQENMQQKQQWQLRKSIYRKQQNVKESLKKIKYLI